MTNKKDPACLFYISTWLTSTAEMDSDCRGWYLNLILHQFDKKSLPNDVEKLAVLAHVKFSEYERFKQVFEQVFKKKFELDENNRLKNAYADKILQSRELFKEKRSQSGKLSYVLKYFREQHGKKLTVKFESFIKENIILDDIDIKNKQVLEQVFKQMFELYINENKIKDEVIDSVECDNEKTLKAAEETFEIFRKSYQGQKRGFETEWKDFIKSNSIDIVAQLKPALDREIAHRARCIQAGAFLPQWKHLKTWINNKCWEQEFGEIPASPKQPQTQTPELPKFGPASNGTFNTIEQWKADKGISTSEK